MTPAMASLRVLPEASVIAAPSEVRYGVYASASPDAPMTELCAPPPLWPKTKMRSLAPGRTPVLYRT